MAQISNFLAEICCMTNRQLFLQHVGQTSEAPLALDIVKASNFTLTDADGKTYIDLIGGISVCNVGHCHPEVVKAVQAQAESYMHIMVYGELVQSPQVQLATMLASLLPASLNSVFFTASGSEATEGALKLAKRSTGRTQVVSFTNSYHGSTQGALTIMGSEYWRNAFRPLIPGSLQLTYNDAEQLHQITERTACVVAETIQAEAGVLVPDAGWLQALRERCTATGTLLVLDEIQCGFGRNGSLFTFEQFGIVPDVLLLGKALGGGMPLGAFVADQSLMRKLTHQPVLGHINTFGGHPVSCAAGIAALKVLLAENWIAQVSAKEQLLHQLLQHKKIKKITSSGLMMAVHFESFSQNKKIIDRLVERGVFTDWFLFASHCLRIAPPLTISNEAINEAAEILLQVLDEQE
jgi:acetylornithine/succinyldiaminopimelate/putrescine aminotransferase